MRGIYASRLNNNSQRKGEKQNKKQFDQLHHYSSRDEDGTSGKVGGNDGDVLRSFHNDPSRLVTRRERRKIEEKRDRQTKRDKGRVYDNHERRRIHQILPLVSLHKKAKHRERKRERNQPVVWKRTSLFFLILFYF
jgi:hypothetical protein